MLINKSTQDVIRVLLNERNKRLTLRVLAEKAGISLGMAVKAVNAIASCGYLEKKNGIKLISWEKLLKAWSYTVSIKEHKKIEFLAAERPQYLIRKISQLLIREEYAYTLFSATEIIAPYVAPDKVHLYILNDNLKKVSKIFEDGGIMQAEKGNIICYLVDKAHLYGSIDVNRIKVISLPQLYIDLTSYSGRGEEASEYIFKILGEKNV